MNNLLIVASIFVTISTGMSWSQTRTWNDLKRGDTVTIAVVGSSWADSTIAQWPRFLATAIDSQFPGQVHLDNRGVAGKQFETILSDFITCVSSPNPPTAIFVEFHPSENNPSDMQNYPDTLSYYREHLRAALALGKIRAPTCDVILWLPYRLCQSFLLPNQEAIENVARTVAIADTIRMADNWWAFEHICNEPCCPQYSDYLYDGSHTHIGAALLVEIEALRALQDIQRDFSPPFSAPANVRAQATGNRSALLQWNAVSDSAVPNLENAITGYAVYRNGSRAGFCNGSLSTFFIDTSLCELSNYSYTVSAFNAQLINGPQSSASTISTPADHTPPQLLKAVSNGNSYFTTLLFDETIDAQSAARAESYTVNDSHAIVLNALPQPDGKSVIIQTDSILTSKSASITISGISDVAHDPNRIVIPQKIIVTPGNVVQGVYYRMVGDLTLSSSIKLSPGAIVQRNPAFQEGISYQLSGTIYCINHKNIGGLLQGLLDIRSAGRYRFFLTSHSDSVEIGIGAATSKILAGPQTRDSITLDLQQGMLPIMLAGFNYEKCDSLFLDLQWSGPGFTRTSILDSLLYDLIGDVPPTGFHGRMISPAAGQIAHPGDSIPIAWTQDNGSTVFQLIFEISFSKGKNWQQLYPSAINSKIGNFLWHVPDSIPGIVIPVDSALIRVSVYGTNGPYIYSPYFSVAIKTDVRLRANKLNPLNDKILVRAIAGKSVLISFNAPLSGSMTIMDPRGRVVARVQVKKGANTVKTLLSKGLYMFQISYSDLSSKRIGKIIL